MTERLATRGVDALWSHQAAAVDALRDRPQHRGRHRHRVGEVALLPAADRRRPSSRAAATPRCWCSRPRRSRRTSSARCASGSCPTSWPRPTTATPPPTSGRGSARTPTCVLTNPEMLHMGILPSHDRWATFLMRLRYVVVDELHTLRGIFGSHVAHVLRRLRRLCEHYGADADLLLHQRDDRQPGRARVAPLRASGRGDRRRRVTAGRARFAVWQRPLLDVHSGTRASANVETAMLLVALRRRRAPDARVHAQPQGRRARRHPRAARSPRHVSPTAPGRTAVAAYRAGYLADERRELEAQLASGELGGVVATSALELGIDVGGPRRGRAQRLPGHARVDAPAGRPRRAHQPPRRRGARRRRRPARPVVRRATRASCSTGPRKRWW